MEDGAIAIRDSKVPDGGMLVLSRSVFGAFLRGAKRGEFDDFR